MHRGMCCQGSSKGNLGSGGLAFMEKPFDARLQVAHIVVEHAGDALGGRRFEDMAEEVVHQGKRLTEPNESDTGTSK